VCHQTVGLTARELEQNGIVTVVIGSAMDIVTHCSVPRYLHNDLPLGNPLGAPYDRQSQLQTVIAALNLAETATSPSVVVSELSWPGDDNWKDAYSRVDESNRATLQAMGAENRRKRAADRADGLTR
jgi:D-proline reductase (dithiol) PrdB